MKNPTACLIIIGNEILSGRTQDKNLAWLAARLNEAGVKLMEVRVVPDIEATIIATVNECRRLFTYIFTTGGIGPTHDDITSSSIAKGLGVPLIRHPEAEAILRRHYTPEQINEARLKMADMPEGASLILNPLSAAPGFRIENIFVLAGVPSIMQAMFDNLKGQLRGGATTHSRTLSAYITEGTLAAALTDIQNAHPDVDIGSYPFVRQERLGTSLVARSTDMAALNTVYDKIRTMLLGFTQEVLEEE